MATQIELQLRVQVRKGKKWVTIDPGNNALLITGPIVDTLARWVAWFEVRGGEHGWQGLCESCLLRVSEQGHAPGCLYAISRKLLEDGELP